ncbi:multidrug-efflux transporter [Bifidobacterium sp. DSM 109958]|uniref:Multidrug-efflux transporter n=1 Tax=Bifidobacterium moraviense TaxID=2675323 RepID=A0A7Y0HZZ3_9BIFI|nr:MFS transporter [Bifidobacterium sp. DSM 109958]NMN00908.1 multidrug-efflux transporter [Bifidobacterium sp. DSM 109958]
MNINVANASITDAQQSRFPWRPSIAQFFATIGFYAPFFGISAVLLPAKIAMIDPDNKVAMTASATTVTLLISVFAGFICGALCDMTRSRFGARTPWIVGGGVLATVCLIVFATASDTTLALGAWYVYVVWYNAIMAAAMAWMPDMIAPRHRGSASAMFGVATQIGLNGAQSLASLYITDVSTGVFTLLIIADIALIVAVVICREKSNRHVPRKPFSLESLKESFLPPRRAGRDYWFAAAARLMYMMPGGIGTYRLYTLTDYMGTPAEAAAKWMSLMAALSLVMAVAAAVLSGPLADHLKTIKVPVAIAVFLVGVPCWLPFFIPTPLMYTIYVALSGLGGGIFVALDQALMTSVLPSKDTAAKDLAFLNVAGTIGQMLAPLLAAAVIGMFGYAGLFPMGFIVLTIAAVSVFGIKNVR